MNGQKCEFGDFYEFDQQTRTAKPQIRKPCKDPKPVYTGSTKNGLWDYYRCETCGASGTIDTGRGD